MNGEKLFAWNFVRETFFQKRVCAAENMETEKIFRRIRREKPRNRKNLSTNRKRAS
jgi:hypothetical protein